MNKILKVCGKKIGHLAILQTGLTQWHSVMGGLNHHGFLTRLSDLTKGAQRKPRKLLSLSTVFLFMPFCKVPHNTFQMIFSLPRETGPQEHIMILLHV